MTAWEEGIVSRQKLVPIICPASMGFTLIEMLITIIVLGILTAVAVPSYRSFIASQRVKNSSFDIIAMLTLTRSEAIKRNVQLSATPVSGDWAKGWAVTAPNGTVISRKDAMPGGLTITCFQGSPLVAQSFCGPASYDGNGRNAGSAQSIQLSSSDMTAAGMRCISIDLSGLPSAKKGACI